MFLFFFPIIHACLHRNLYMTLRNWFSFKLEQTLITCNSSKHTLLYNLYNSVDAAVISTTSSIIFFIQCTGLTTSWILCLAVRWDVPATNFCTRNWPEEVRKISTKYFKTAEWVNNISVHTYSQAANYLSTCILPWPAKKISVTHFSNKSHVELDTCLSEMQTLLWIPQSLTKLCLFRNAVQKSSSH